MPHPGGHDVTAGDDLLAGQVAYHPHRAGEYDMTAVLCQRMRGTNRV